MRNNTKLLLLTILTALFLCTTAADYSRPVAGPAPIAAIVDYTNVEVGSHVHEAVVDVGRVCEEGDHECAAEGEKVKYLEERDDPPLPEDERQQQPEEERQHEPKEIVMTEEIKVTSDAVVQGEINGAAENKAEVPQVEEKKMVEDPNCPSRPHVIRCAAKYLDTNHNGALERAELEKAMSGVSWLLRGLLHMIGSVEMIMSKCDADGDGVITIEHDMEATKETCLATCFKRYAFKSLFFPECEE